jgi:hypothetical protein
VFQSHKDVLNTGFWWLLKQDQKSIFEYGVFLTTCASSIEHIKEPLCPSPTVIFPRDLKQSLDSEYC